MLKHYLISKFFIIQFLTFTFCVMVFFIPQNVFAASTSEVRFGNPDLIIMLLFSVVAMLAAVLINYFMFVRNLRKIDKENKTVGMPDIVQTMLGAAAHSIYTSIISVDTEENILYINPAAEEVLGYSKAEAIGMPLSAIYDEASLLNIKQLANNPKEKSKGQIISRLKTKAGTWQDVINIVFHIKNSNSSSMGTIIIMQPHKVLDEAAISVETTSFDILETSPPENNVDMLTHLPNRKLLFDYLNNILINAAVSKEKYALMLINLDFFRSINNNLGYEIGDTILKECAKRLKALFTENGFLSRMDGDEFGLIVKISGPDDIEAVANKIFDSMKEPVVISTQEVYISVSIGISYFPDQGKNSSEIIRNAASSVNMVKNTRRGSYRIFSTDISRYNFQKFNIHAELRQALERKEFVLHYQPKIDGQTGQIVGIEALIRWNHPERGLLYPIDFIPVAEETGIIKYIDEWVLHTACSQLKLWTEEGIKDMRLAVNLSAWQFKDQHLVETVAKVLADTQIPPSLLELEITETAAIENISFTQSTLAKLIKMGVTISIDDFGTGYSSLNYLKNFPINFLKIDKSFIDDIIKDENTYSIVRAIIEVAHALKLKVIAEGVENQEQLKLLKNLGCDEVQGFLISKPLSVEDIKKAFIE